MSMRSLLRSAAIVAATCVVTAACVLAIATYALVAKPGTWSIPMRIGVFGLGPTLDIGVAPLIRIATQPLGIAVLDGHGFATRFGRLRFTRDGETLVIDCTSCSIDVPGLGNDRIVVPSARFTIVERADRLAGSIDAGAIRGHYSARLDDASLKFEIALERAPVADWYRLFGDRIPEMRIAHVYGTAAFALRLSLPDGAFAVRPDIEGFAVDGLGTEALAGRMPRTDCVVGGEPRARGFGRWLPLAVVAAEDQRFAEHPGFDLRELAVALSHNQTTPTIERGASTIPQQLARILYVGSEHSTSRKLRELLYAVEMEHTLGKARMLNLYLAVAPWGAGVCGAQSAARRYFDTDAASLTAAQSVWLAAMLHAPDREFEEWQAHGGIDLARATWVADGLTYQTAKLPRATRMRLQSELRSDLRALAAPLPTQVVDADRAVATVLAQDASAP
jgi:Transglycosylase